MGQKATRTAVEEREPGLRQRDRNRLEHPREPTGEHIPRPFTGGK